MGNTQSENNEESLIPIDIDNNKNEPENLINSITRNIGTFAPESINKLDINIISQDTRNIILDIAIEEGKLEIVKKFYGSDTKPSLYAEQMAQVNGHHSTSLFASTYFELRNKTGIETVHKSHNGWNDCIPENCRF